MKAEIIPICGWCFAEMHKRVPVKILSGMKNEERCSVCGRLCFGYVVEVGDEPDNTRRPGDIKKAVP